MADDLAGEVTIRVSDQHADLFTRNQVAILVEQNLRPTPPVTYAAWQAVARPAMADQRLMDHAIDAAMDVLRPWARPDRIELPVTLFPRLARLTKLARTMRRKPRRLAVWCASQRRKDGRSGAR